MSVEESPLVSIIMGVYNAEKFLVPAIESVLQQTYTNIELVIVDDGSTDSTTKILKDFEAKDFRVKVVLQQNEGLTRALNTAASVAEGVYLARMDADDICHKERIEKQADFLQKNMDIDLVGTALMLIDDEGKKKRFYTNPLYDEQIKARLEMAPAFAHPSIMMRKIPFIAIGGYRPAFRYAQDYDLYLRLIKETKFANLPEPLLFHRVHSARVSDERRAEQALCGAMARYDYRVGGGAVHEDEDLSTFDIGPFKFGTEEQRETWFYHTLFLCFRAKRSDFYDVWLECPSPALQKFFAVKVFLFLLGKQRYKDMKEYALTLYSAHKTLLASPE
ncbi:MAG: glycosyltransferase [Alphaproteobacteria bacterium]|nr:glycosyltransferase [Alphaproteobacteria bacterium]